ncbi:MAG: hypothetical protein E4G91_01340 [Candidatus Zixiibacteriota bacterium]|nr:MAG: hypothetical protein E4G91_01340 [candidate division Zixibacteria bacterium]
MTKFDDIFVPLGKSLVDGLFGLNATHRRVTRAFDAVTGKNVTSNSDTAIKVSPPAGVSVALQYTRLPDSVIKSGDQFVYISSAAGIVPQSGDFFIIRGETWQVVEIQPIVSGELTAATVVVLRK